MGFFKKYVYSKIVEMEQDGLIENRINENVEKSIYNAVDEVFGNKWSDFSKGLQEKMAKEVPCILESIDMTSAREYMLSKANDYINNMFEHEVSEKISDNLKRLFVNNYHGITINNIYDKFIELINDISKDEYDKENLDIDDGNCSIVFDLSINDRDYNSSFKDCVLTIRKKEDEDYITAKFTVYEHDLKGESNESLSSLEIDGKLIDNRTDFHYFNKFELMFINIYLSKTKINFGNINRFNFDTSICVEDEY